MASSSRTVPVAVMSVVYSGRIEADPHMALRGQIVNLRRLHLAQQAAQPARVAQIAVMEEQPRLVGVRIGINLVEPAGVERARPADDAMHLVAFGQQQLRQIGTILSGNPRDKRALNHRDINIRQPRPDSQAKKAGKEWDSGCGKGGGGDAGRPVVGRISLSRACVADWISAFETIENWSLTISQSNRGWTRMGIYRCEYVLA